MSELTLEEMEQVAGGLGPAGAVRGPGRVGVPGKGAVAGPSLPVVWVSAGVWERGGSITAGPICGSGPGGAR